MKPALVVQAALTLICLHATACGQTQLQESDRAVIAFDFQIQKFTESARSNGIELVELLEIKLPGLLREHTLSEIERIDGSFNLPSELSHVTGLTPGQDLPGDGFVHIDLLPLMQQSVLLTFWSSSTLR